MIREFTETDFDTLITLEKQSHFAPWSAEAFQQCFISGCPCWVIEHEQQVIGFIIATIHVGECHILNLCIHADYQHQGLGRQLLLHALKAAKTKRAGIAYLEVRRSNLHAIALYKKVGFVEIGERPAYYQDAKGREDAIIYAKDLGIDDEL